ncbi:MAG: hypothetical protein OEY59_02850 [Deltaproteobacteria bacterium]|nr:hypothetical protein [Deltaproteobacteria bacterium]
MMTTPKATDCLDFRTKSGKGDLFARVQIIGRDLLIGVWGGDSPHIGAVAISQPRESLNDINKISASSSVFCFLGHKEDELAKIMAEKLTRSLNAKVILSMGIHFNEFEQSVLNNIYENADILSEIITAELKGYLET